jgi:pyoverdine/dityrosine biosynthesis protein Dit1
MDPVDATHGLPNSFPSVDDVALDILALVMRHRRVAPDSEPCGQPPCGACLAPHLARVRRAVVRDEAIIFVLPAFPAKSPNPAKVLGPLPDMAEQCSLEMLDGLCRRIRRYYAPGARIVLCSDGRVFSDVVGMRELDVTAYQAELRRMIARLPGRSLDTFDLEDVYPGVSFVEMREQLIQRHGTPLPELKSAVLGGGEPQRLYCGITRFLLEDAARPGLTMSRTALQKDCRRRAYEVIQRSKAWGDLLASCFPDAVRLSIHPQSCGSEKLGIGFVPATGPWLTPWHAVAVDIGGRFVLRRRAEAEAMGARLIEEGGRPSHYVLPDVHASENLPEAVNAR